MEALRTGRFLHTRVVWLGSNLFNKALLQSSLWYPITQVPFKHKEINNVEQFSLKNETFWFGYIFHSKNLNHIYKDVKYLVSVIIPLGKDIIGGDTVFYDGVKHVILGTDHIY